MPTLAFEDCRESGNSDVCILLASDSESQERPVPLLERHTFRTAFNDSGYELAAFMLCNAPGRLSCEVAEVQLSQRFDSEPCRQLYFVALVNGHGYQEPILAYFHAIEFAMKGSFGNLLPVRTSMPDTETGLVPCFNTAYAILQRWPTSK